jgi:hypothetical protein
MASNPKGQPMEVPHDREVEVTDGQQTEMATTTFVDDHKVVSQDETHITHIDSTMLRVFQSQAATDDIISFLKKPVKLFGGNFSISDTYSLLTNTRLPRSAFTTPQGVLWTEKLRGFFGIRMDMRVRIVVNANKFQQGRYCLGWVNHGAMTPTLSKLKNTDFQNMHMATLVQRTTIPHVELDLANDTAAEMLIPFQAPISFYPLNGMYSPFDDYPDLGYLSLYPYSPMITPEGSTVAGYTVYVSFENVSLYGAASPQAGLDRKETSNKSLGPISGISAPLAKGFKEFANIPTLGVIAKPISWVADCVTNVATFFGLSKPNPGSNSGRMQIVSMPGHSTVDGDSDARTLGYLSQPGTLPIVGISGTDYDEMDFSFIKSKPAYFQQFLMRDTDVSTTVLTSWNVDPYSARIDTAGVGGTVSHFPPVSFLAAQFKYWRGSLTYRLKIVKTSFHSGRISIAFFPVDELSLTSNEQYVNRMIVDIRDCTEVEFTVPYISRRPWTTLGERIGQITITVVDPLVAPTTVSPNITILAEVYGGKDFEVAVMGQFSYNPSRIIPQGLELGEGDALFSQPLGASTSNADPVLMTSACIGEKITSVRALIKRFTPIRRLLTNAGGDNNGKTIKIIPDAIPCINGILADPTIAFSADTYAIWASCYAMVGGGIRFRDVIDTGLLTANGAVLHAPVVSSYDIQDNSVPSAMMINSAPSIYPVNYPLVLNSLEKDSSLTVELPQYTRTLARSVGDLMIFQFTGAPSYEDYTPTGNVTGGRLSFSIPENSTVTPVAGFSVHKIYRAGADDAQFYSFISVPPMFNTPSVDTSTFA